MQPYALAGSLMDVHARRVGASREAGWTPRPLGTTVTSALIPCEPTGTCLIGPDAIGLLDPASIESHHAVLFVSNTKMAEPAEWAVSVKL